jgi:hypothetical protein
MPTIKARPTDTTTEVRLLARLTKRNHDTLLDYTRMIGEGENVSYVLSQLIETVLAKDKDFLDWRRNRADEPAGDESGTTRRTRVAGGGGGRGPVAVIDDES